MPYLSEALGGRRRCSASAATSTRGRGLPPAPRWSSSPARDGLLSDEPGDVLACGPEPMLEAVRALVPGAQLAWEAPMACGYGACYGCVVEIDGRYERSACPTVLREAA